VRDPYHVIHDVANALGGRLRAGDPAGGGIPAADELELTEDDGGYPRE